MVEYSEEIEEGVKQYFDSLSKVKPLTKKQEHDLFINYKVLGDLNARNTLITSNLRFASKIAGSFRWSGIPYSELIGYANDGLIEAIDKFDINIDVKFFSYAKWWIIAHVEKAIRKKQRMPSSELPTDHESHSLSEDAMETSTCNIETVQDNYIYEASDNEEEMTKEQLVEKFLSVLSSRERKMVCMYYGVNEPKDYNLQEIGEKYNISKERVRQIIENAFKKIRAEAILTESARI